MAITIFKDKNCQGASDLVGSDIRDLKDRPADKPGSIRLSEPIDSVLLFKNDDWHEGALFIRGQKTVTDLGSAKEGGRLGFGNSIRSVRITPFTLRLNISVVTNGTVYPGIWPTDWWAEGVINDVVKRANDFYLAQHAVLNLEVSDITFRDDFEHFNVTIGEVMKFPGDWKRDSEVDVIFVNRFEKDGIAGCAHKPLFGETVILSVMNNSEGAPDAPRLNQEMAVNLVHELGHYLGLGHGTANENPSNIMIQSHPPTAQLADFELWDDQIRQMHDRLANHHTRRGDRVD
jgi:hypothetical protein